jgi:hypothetical protein
MYSIRHGRGGLVLRLPDANKLTAPRTWCSQAIARQHAF